jgi:hypothetical protein
LNADMLVGENVASDAVPKSQNNNENVEDVGDHEDPKVLALKARQKRKAELARAAK